MEEFSKSTEDLSSISNIDIPPSINIGNLLPFATIENSPKNAVGAAAVSTATETDLSHSMKLPTQIAPSINPWASSSSTSISAPQPSPYEPQSSIGSSSMFFSAYSTSTHARHEATKNQQQSGFSMSFPFASFMQESKIDAKSGLLESQHSIDNDDMISPAQLQSITLEPKSSFSSTPTSKPRAPSSIYAEIPSFIPASTRPSAYAKLLPETTDSLSHNKPQKEVKYQDRFFAILFSVCFWLMNGLGVFYLLTTTSQPNEITDSLFFAFSQTSKYIITLLFASFIIGLLWIAILRRFLQPAIWLTVVLVPASFFALSIWGFYEAFNSPPQLDFETKWLIPESLLSLIFGVVSSYLIHSKKRHITRSIKLSEISFEILAANPSLFMVCLAILLLYMLFSAVWLAMFASIMLIGHVEPLQNDQKYRWVPDPSSGWLAAFFLFMFLWTSSVFHYLQRCTISGVVCEWYFHRFDPVKNMWKKDIPVYAFWRSATMSFGSICFAAIVLTAIQAVRVVTDLFKRVSRRIGTENPVSKLFIACVEALEGLTEGLNSYSLVYISYSGTDFLSAASKSTALFRRNLISALLTDNLAKFILLFGVYAVSLGCFMATFTFSIQDLNTPYAWAVSSVGTMLAFFLVRFCTLILVQVMDALYVCYVIDIDSGKCHSQAVHEAFMDSANISDCDS